MSAASLSLTAGVLASMTRNIYLLATTVGLIGVGLGFFRVRSLSIACQQFSAEQRSLALSIGLAGTPMGSSTLPVLWRFLLDRFTVHQVMLILSGLLGQMFIAALLFKEPTSITKSTKSQPDTLRQIYTFPMILYMLGLFLIFSGKISQFPYFVPFSESIGLTDYEPASILVIMNIVDIIGRPIGGYLSGTAFVRKHSQSLFLGIFIGALGIMDLLSRQIISDFNSFAIWAGIFGLIYALPVSSQMSAICEYTDVKNMNSVLSINALILIFGVLIGPIVNGALVDYTGSYWSTFYLSGGMLVGGVSMIFLARFIQNLRQKKNGTNSNL